MTRPTTDGDTKAAIEVVREVIDHLTDWAWDENGVRYRPKGLAALDLITTRLSEQEVELERLGRMLGDTLEALFAARYPDSQPFSQVVGTLNHEPPTTEDREGSAPG